MFLILAVTGTMIVPLPANTEEDEELEAEGHAPLCFGQHPTNTPTSGADIIFGTEGNDVLFGGGGDDDLFGDDINAETVVGGDDELRGGGGNDDLFGDDISGSIFLGGNDSLFCGTGTDIADGDGGGNDTADGCEFLSGVP
jgi:Ca2+-binding RTX toxin-like protein